jgi:peroxiredoxin
MYLALTRNTDFEQMKRFAKQHNFSFRYVVDETQEVAPAYDAPRTLDFLRLQRRP